MNKIEFKLKGKCGIYVFTNLENGKRYVGSSVDLYNRLHEHVHNLKNNKAHNAHFQASWNKYGEDSFIYGVLEYCNEANQFEREQYYIDLIHPEYNLTLNVVANFGHKVSESTKEKISKTLKDKYKSGEITAYRQNHNWKKTYIYNIRTFKLEAECDCEADAFRLLKQKNTHNNSRRIFSNRYIMVYNKFDTLSSLKNYFYENFYKQTRSSFGNYIVTEDEDGNLQYYESLIACAHYNIASKSTLSKHKSFKENPYILKNGKKFYYLQNYIPYTENRAVLIEQSSELLSGNIGELTNGNPEITSEITKGSEASYSVESE